MNELSTYTDYRLLLKDFYDTARMKNPRFSWQVFSHLAAIPSRGFLCNVVRGRRKLSRVYVAGLAKALKLNKAESDYFEHLVAFTDAPSAAEKNRHYERMTSVRLSDRVVKEHGILSRQQYRFYSQWYHPVVRSLIGLHGFDGDFERMARMVNPPISASQVKRSVGLLESLGLIVKSKETTYKIAERTVTTPPEVISLAVYNYHAQTAEIASRALAKLPRERRNFSAVTLGISNATYSKVCREIDQFRKRLLELAQDDNLEPETRGVYQLNLQLFSVSGHPNQKEHACKS